MYTLTELKAVMQERGFRPQKLFGQNFLIDKNVAHKIVSLIAPPADGTLLEVGPGFGALTAELAQRAGELVLIERDRVLADHLRTVFGGVGTVRIIEGDVLAVDLGGVLAAGQRSSVAGNLPYYVTTPLIERLITLRERIDTMTFTVQKEVGERMAARPGTPAYGSLSCFVQFYTEPACLMTIRPMVFYPAPRVDSVLIRLRVRRTPAVSVPDEAFLFRVIRAGFSQRRKMLVNSLDAAGIVSCPKETIAGLVRRVCGDESVRAERISLESFAELSGALRPFAA